MALSPKHRKFCEEYLSVWNATDAYQAAYPKVSRDVARANGARLLANASISEEIQRRVEEITLSANEVLARLAEHARAEYSAYLTAEGVDLDRMIADGKRHLIKGFKETAFGRIVEFYDAQAALVHIGKHHKLFTDKVEVEHSGSVEITADERAQAAKELEKWNEQKKAGGISNG